MKRQSVISLILTLCLGAAALLTGCNAPISDSAASEPSQTAATAIAADSSAEAPSADGYTMADIAKLNNTQNFAKNTLEHIFDGTINGKGKATGYHYAGMTDSKGKIIGGTESKKDKNGVYTAKVKVNGVKKEGFSTFYPDEWTPQQVVDAINTAYDDALSNSDNPHGSLWIGYSGDLEIDMYLNNSKKITTAFPVKQ